VGSRLLREGYAQVTDNLTTNEDLNKHLNSAVRRSHQAHRGYVATEDLHQEAWLWVLAHPDKVNELLFSEEDPKGKKRLLELKIYQALHNHTMRQRYLKDGTKPGDYFTYKRELLELLLPEALDGLPPVAPEFDTDQMVRSRRAPSETGDKMAMLADVKAGVASLPEADKRFLTVKYAGAGVSDERLAELFGLSGSTCSRRLTQVMQRLARFLGSDVPVRRRRVVSNASAIAETNRQED